MREADREMLLERWARLCHGLSTAQVRRTMFDRLYAAYTGPDRHYHDLGHIADCLRELDGVRQLASRADAIEAAIWFHDLIYDGRRTDNEEQSAEEAGIWLTLLGADVAFIDEVKRLIVFTRHDRDPEATDGRLMVDIDLASLALPAEQFDENSRRIRLEYPHTAEADFRRARTQMLQRFLDRPHIYFTPVFRDRYETRARENLQRVVAAG
ncbi:MAG: hypothetical protein ABIP55_05880 [Tepidisphaeraceae bacterium]